MFAFTHWKRHLPLAGVVAAGLMGSANLTPAYAAGPTQSAAVAEDSLASAICGRCGRPHYRCQCCPTPSYPSTTPQTPAAPGTTPDAPSPDTTTMDLPQYQPAPSFNNLASSTPFLMGDSFSGGGVNLQIANFSVNAAHPAAVTSRINLAENGTPIPQDRFFITQRHYHNAAPLDIFGFVSNSDVDRTTYGFERTFWSRMASVEVRVPFNYQLDSDLQADYAPDDPVNPIPDLTGADARAYELGNVNLAFKFKLIENTDQVVSAGLSVMLPTARSINVHGRIFATDIPGAFGQTYDVEDFRYQFLITNETVNLTPFIAVSRQWSENVFTQSFWQIDVPVMQSHATFAYEGLINTVPENDFGTLDVNIQTLLRWNQQFGVWLMRDGCGVVRNWAALAELSYTGTLETAVVNEAVLFDAGGGAADPDSVVIGVGPGFKRQDIVNLSLGSSFDIARSNLIVGYVFPLNSGDRKPFDGEITAQWNRRF